MSDRGRSSAPLSGVLGPETYSGILVLRADVDDLAEVQADRAVLGLELVPAAVAEGLVEALQLVLADAQREHLTALEADADPARAGSHQCAPRPAAGSTISVST